MFVEMSRELRTDAQAQLANTDLRLAVRLRLSVNCEVVHMPRPRVQLVNSAALLYFDA